MHYGARTSACSHLHGKIRRYSQLPRSTKYSAYVFANTSAFAKVMHLDAGMVYLKHDNKVLPISLAKSSARHKGRLLKIITVFTV
eukprot:g1210.t1